MARQPLIQEEFLISSKEEGARYFVAKQHKNRYAYLKISSTGETLIAIGNTYCHNGGAYCLIEHRGKGMYQNLLNFVIETFKVDSFSELGVDFG